MNNKNLIVAHGDLDGITSAALLAEKLGIETEDLNVVFTQPHMVDQVIIPDEVEKVYVVDIAINNRDPKMTEKFIANLGDKLVRWYDHHEGWDQIADDRFCIKGNQSCAGMIGGVEKRCDIRVADAIAADTRTGNLSANGQLIERAVKADMSNDTIRMWAVKLLMGAEEYRNPLKGMERAYQMIENETYRLAEFFEVDGDIAIKYTSKQENLLETVKVAGVDYTGTVAFVDVSDTYAREYGQEQPPGRNYNLTQLLLAGQELATFAIVKTVNPISKEEMVTIATKSKTNLVELFGLVSGAPFRVTLPASRLEEVIEKLQEVV